MNRKSLLRSAMVVGTLIVITATAAVAGNGVGGVFNLGQNNTVNARTQLQGHSATQSLRVVNASTAAGAGAIAGESNRGTGVQGSSASRIGVRALTTNTTGVNYGIYATTASENGLAGFFQNTNAASPTRRTALRAISEGSAADLPSTFAGAGEFIGANGVIGVSISPTGYGVLGRTAAASGYGVVGRGEGSNGVGVFGSGTQYGVYSFGNARVAGNLSVSGTLTKGSGTFKIDHPLDPANKYLSHSFVESPDMMNIYNGNVVTDAEGVAVVELPSYFEALNRDPRYQLTVIGSFAAAQIAEEISDNRFTIQTEEPNVKVSWQVTGIRQDAYAEAHPVVVEEEKAVADRGFYLHPEEFGRPASLGIGRQMAEQTNVGTHLQ